MALKEQNAGVKNLKLGFFIIVERIINPVNFYGAFLFAAVIPKTHFSSSNETQFFIKSNGTHIFFCHV